MKTVLIGTLPTINEQERITRKRCHRTIDHASTKFSRSQHNSGSHKHKPPKAAWFSLRQLEDILIKQFPMSIFERETTRTSKEENIHDQTVISDNEEDFACPTEEDTELVKNVKLWLGSMIGGPEKFICAIIAFFLFLFIIFIQLYVHILARYETFQSLTLCEMLVTNYNRFDEDVTFECHVKLLISSWVAAMFSSAIVLVLHFIVWNIKSYFTFSKHDENDKENGQRYSFHNIEKAEF